MLVVITYCVGNYTANVVHVTITSIILELVHNTQYYCLFPHGFLLCCNPFTVLAKYYIVIV